MTTRPHHHSKLPVVNLTLSNTWFLGTMQVYTATGISIGSAILHSPWLCESMVVPNTQTVLPATFGNEAASMHCVQVCNLKCLHLCQLVCTTLNFYHSTDNNSTNNNSRINQDQHQYWLASVRRPVDGQRDQLHQQLNAAESHEVRHRSPAVSYTHLTLPTILRV